LVFWEVIKACKNSALEVFKGLYCKDYGDPLNLE